ncbi:uncharacterized protein LOC124669595 [Lolium rigidum]|uniref:uncharacterized protein LOC124669595 n=1 Tax=Lolium rigidum TaxID=89674 RepID=UPI001F5C39BA|nr:uncharacterized protein LOC124669595 [Lolium rigidum]
MEVVELQQARAHGEIGDIFKMMLKIYKSEEARSMEVSKKGSFELGSISSHFSQMWDNGRQIRQLFSTDAKFLPTSMLAHDTLVGHVSTLELCSEHIDWLCRWVPQFAERLERIKKDDPMDKKMLEMAEMEEVSFACYIRSWERVRRRDNSIRFEDSTTLSPMLFTHYMPGYHPLFADLTQTMQIFSIKITELVGFNWPLEVYGVVAARDAVDYRRNHLFLRSRDNCQFLKDKEDSYLHLTGPSRAIMSEDTVRIEFQLKVKGTMKSEDRHLITEQFACDAHGAGTSIIHSIDGCFCTMELCSEYFRGSIQATIISICVTQGSLPDGAQVICFSLPEEDTEGKDERRTNHVVLFDNKNGAVPVDEEGYLKLSRQVVPVQLEGKLEVVTKTDAMMSRSVFFTPELSNISQESCILGDDCTLEITVAWSLLVDDEQHMMMMSYTNALVRPKTFPYMKLVQDTQGGSC